MTLYADIIMSAGFVVLMVIAVLFIAHERRELLEYKPEHMKTYPPLPELVCTCGDCWEINVGMPAIGCGCGTIYTVIMTREEP